ncbi:MAG: hypothetical protein CBC88_00270 [Candidatus Pelagibacter sp. TMED128]|nr:MAG: hypothetical protein CBC88_00270 [Candidatus Pelagibacter sp. TMED128]|tara:strand:+ start:2917 stop:3717 length:801 start_codon:yes stop_codon:yes gene_type:complete
MITIITGDHPRHQFLVKSIAENNIIDTWIIQKRENFQTNSYTENNSLSKLEKIHFDKRDKAEHDFFSSYKKINQKNIKKIIKIQKEDIENGNLAKKLKKFENINLITYGCQKLGDEILNLFKLNRLNIHGGLSPWYRGSATHFWPSYLLEPEFTGMTFHHLTQNIDGGDIVHQTVVNLNAKDNLHENACRCVKDFIIELNLFVEKKVFDEKIIGVKQKTTGRIWTSKMWHPALLEVIYNKFEDKINKFCLENKKLRKPKILSNLSR